jgi:hypothetical protein
MIMAWFRSLLVLVVALGPAGIRGDARADQESDEALISTITEQLPTLPRRDLSSLMAAFTELFDDADQPRLMRLAQHSNFSIAMWARWQMSDSLFGSAFDPENQYYPVRFLELKGIEVPTPWARAFAAQFLPSKALRRQAGEYYRKRTTCPARMSLVTTEPRTYVHCARCDIPAGTEVTESETHLTVKQAGISVRVEKPLTSNFYAIALAAYGESLFLPLVTKDTTHILYVRGAHLMPFELTCFDTRSGVRRWETVGWSAWPTTVDVVPRNLLPPSLEAMRSETVVGRVLVPGRDEVDAGRGGGQSGPHFGACSYYLVANDRYVTVFGEELGILFVEVFDVHTGRNILRFATHYHPEKAAPTSDREG